MGLPRYTLTLETSPPAVDLAVLHAGLDTFNRASLDFSLEQDHQLVCVMLRAADGTVNGGLLGATLWGWLYISVLYVDEALRGQGFGSDLMHIAEETALQRGCHSAYVDTHGFQALRFYQKLGYEIFGELADFPPGDSRYFLRKRLSE